MFIVVHATQVSQPMKVYVRVDAVSFLDVFFMEYTKTGYNLDLDVALEWGKSIQFPPSITFAKIGVKLFRTKIA